LRLACVCDLSALSASASADPNTQRGDARFTTKLCFDGRDTDALAAAVAAARAAIKTFDELPPAPAPAAKL
jgi:hypothetical protein